MSHAVIDHQYFGVYAMFAISVVIFFALVFAAATIGNMFASKNRTRLGLSPYECGPTPQRQQNKINSQFFTFTLIFILFDIEILILFPWAACFKHLGLFGLIEILIFIGLLVLGFLYAYQKGALRWQQIK